MSVVSLGEKEQRLVEELQQLAAQQREWSEFDTCDAIILRALREIGGYRYGDYRAQQFTTAGYPDFTFLPDTPHAWYLEAKALRVDLSDQHAVQALNYANATGRRWVVLSNGREWRLYDQHLKGAPADKLVATVTLENAQELVDFLRAVGKQSMQSGGVEAYARRQRLKHVLDEQLANPRSEVIRAVVSRLRALGLNGVTGDEVISYFRGTEPSPPPPPPPGDGYRLDELAQRAEQLAKGRKPVSIRFPDNTTRAVDEWKKLVLAVIEWFRERLPPSPQPRHAGSKRYLYHDQPSHERREMLAPQEIQVAGRRLFVETWVSAEEHLKALVYLCECVGEPASGFRVQVRE